MVFFNVTVDMRQIRSSENGEVFFINVYILLACMTSSFDIRVVYILSEDGTFKMKSPQFLKDQFLSKKTSIFEQFEQ